MPFNTVTWPGLLAHIPPEERNGLDLEEFLENKIEASVFAVEVQRVDWSFSSLKHFVCQSLAT